MADGPGPNDELHAEYFRTKDRELQAELIRRYERLAYRLSRRAAKGANDVEDFDQVALIGLVKALWRFDPAKGFEFTTFAWATIEGELKRHRRDSAWAVRVPRALQERFLKTSAVIEDLTHELGRSPTLTQVAEQLGESVESVIEAISVRDAQSVTSLDSTADDDRSSSEPADPRHPMVEAENRAEVEGLLSRLTDRERAVVTLRFFEELSQREIGERLGLSQMHVSRLLARALDRMREWSVHPRLI